MRPCRRGARASHRRKQKKKKIVGDAGITPQRRRRTRAPPIEAGADRCRVVPREVACATVALASTHTVQTAVSKSARRRSAPPTARRSPADPSLSSHRVDRDVPHRGGARSPSTPPKGYRRDSHAGREVEFHHRRISWRVPRGRAPPQSHHHPHRHHPYRRHHRHRRGRRRRGR